MIRHTQKSIQKRHSVTLSGLLRASCFLLLDIPPYAFTLVLLNPNDLQKTLMSHRLINLFSATIISLGTLHAADFYVSNSGNDSNPGTQASPFATVAKGLNSSSGGDNIFLARGSTFREGSANGLSVGDGRSLKSYGSTALPLPVVSGSTLATGWTPWAANPAVLTTSFTSGAVNQIFLNGQRLTLARTPNTGWLRAQAGSNNNTIKDTNINGLSGGSVSGGVNNRWQGAQVRWRKWTWIYETRPIVSSNGDTLNLGGTTTLDLTGEGSGYFIDNSLAALDAPGEWFFNTTTNVLYVYPPAGTNTGTMQVEAAWRSTGFDLNNGTLEDITLQHYQRGMQINGASTVRRATVQWISGSAIDMNWNSGGTLVTGSTVRDVFDNGINLINNPGGPTGNIIERNEFTRIGSVQGYAGNGSWRGTAIAIFVGPAMTIRLNRFTDIGYAGVLPGVPNILIQRNVFTRCMSSLNDGGAIYTNTDSTIIRENIILDTIGDLESSQEWFPLGHGIWPEFLSRFANTEITDNTVYGSGGHGVWLPNNYNCNISRNTLVSNRLSALSLGGAEDEYANPAAAYANQNHTIANNILAIGGKPWVALPGLIQNSPWWYSDKDYLLMYQVYGDRDIDYGTMSGNRMVNQDGLERIKQESGVEQTIAQWQASEPSWRDPAPLTNVGNSFLFINDTEAAINFPLPAGNNWQTLAGASAGSAISIAPFRSALLMATSGSTANLKGYYLASEASSTNGLVTFRSTYNLAPNGTQDAATPAGDGIENLLKYAFNMIGTGTAQASSLETPNNSVLAPAGAAGLPLVDLDNTGKLRITYIRRKSGSNPGINYEVQTSDDLVTWVTTLPVTSVVTSIDGILERVSVIETASAPTKRFVRIRISAL